MPEMTPAWPAAPASPHERHLAAATHVLSIWFPYLAPIIAYFLFRRTSKFVASHALQALFEALILSIVLVVAGAISIAFTIAKVWELVQTRGQSFSWDLVWQAALKAVATWIILGVISLWYTVASILQAIQAYQGRWKPRFLSGRLAGRATGVLEARDR